MKWILNEFIPALAVTAMLVAMIISYMFTFATYVSDPAAHPPSTITYGTTPYTPIRFTQPKTPSPVANASRVAMGFSALGESGEQ